MSNPTPEERADFFLTLDLADEAEVRAAIVDGIRQAVEAERAACALTCRKLRERRKAQMAHPILGGAFCGEAAGADQCERLIRGRGKW